MSCFDGNSSNTDGADTENDSTIKSGYQNSSSSTSITMNTVSIPKLSSVELLTIIAEKVRTKRNKRSSYRNSSSNNNSNNSSSSIISSMSSSISNNKVDSDIEKNISFDEETEQQQLIKEYRDLIHCGNYANHSQKLLELRKLILLKGNLLLIERDSYLIFYSKNYSCLQICILRPTQFKQ